MSDLALIVGGRRYNGWKSVRVTRSIESLAGSFHLDVSDRWGGQDQPWPIAEEDPCRVEIDNDVVIDGYVDKRNLSVSATSRSLSYSGRDAAAALVDCSALLKTWSFSGVSIYDMAKTLADPFGIAVRMQAGTSPPTTKKREVVNPGDSPFEVLHRAALAVGMLLVSDGAGGVLITRAGTGRATPLVEGANVVSCSVEYDATQRFRRYIAISQVAATNFLEDDTGKTADAVTKIRAEATDPAVRRASRVLIIQPEAGVTADYAKKRADWEARVRAAKAETVNVSVLGWRQGDRKLWPLNALVKARLPSIGVDGEMLISEIDHSLGDGGEVTQLKLVRPDAFTPEPEAVVKTSGGAWKELAGGVR